MRSSLNLRTPKPVREKRKRSISDVPRPVQVGAVLLALVAVVALFGPLLAQFPPNEPHYSDKLLAPDSTYWFGTDQYGRDQFARTVNGLRLSLISAILVLLGSTTVSVLVGIAAGLSGGALDTIASRMIDIVLAIPSLVLALAIVGLLGPGYGNLLLALVISSWATDARIARALTMEARTFPFVTAARISGSSTAAIGVRHILPAVLPQIAIISTLRLGGIVVSLAGLSFLGLGVQMPTAELGAMLGDGRRFLTAAPWLLIAPSIAILLIATGANLLAEGLQQKSKGPR